MQRIRHRSVAYFVFCITFLIVGTFQVMPHVFASGWRNLGAVTVTSQIVNDQSLSLFDAFVQEYNTSQDGDDWEKTIQTLKKAVYWDGTARDFYLIYTAYWYSEQLERIDLSAVESTCQDCQNDLLLMFLIGAGHYRTEERETAWEIWRLAPDLDVLLSALGFRFLNIGERNKAYEFWEGAESINSEPKVGKARTYKYMCERSFRFQQWAEAERWCRLWRLVEPTLRTDIMLAHALIGNDDISSATAIIDNASQTVEAKMLGMAGQIAWLHGRVAAKRGDWPQAFSSFEQALEFIPDNSILYLHYAEALLEDKRYDMATLMLDKAEALDNGTLRPQITQLRLKVKQWE